MIITVQQDQPVSFQKLAARIVMVSQRPKRASLSQIIYEKGKFNKIKLFYFKN